LPKLLQLLTKAFGIVEAELLTGKAQATVLQNVNITINCFISAVFAIVQLLK